MQTPRPLTRTGLLVTALLSLAAAPALADTVGEITTMTRPTLKMPKLAPAPVKQAPAPVKALRAVVLVRADTAALTFRGAVFDLLSKLRAELDNPRAKSLHPRLANLNLVFNAIDKVANILRAADRGAKRAISDVFRPGDDTPAYERARKLFDKVEAYLRKNGALKKRASAMVTHFTKAIGYFPKPALVKVRFR